MLKNKTTSVIIFFCIIKLTLHLIADYHSGFQQDELLHIQTGNHLAFGYMEFPPVIGLLAFIQNLFHSQSVFVHHIFAHIASLLILIIASRATIELGGKTKAVFIVLLCMLIAPGFYRSEQLFQPVVFSQLFWMLSFYQLVRFVKYLQPKYLWYLIISLAVGFLTKYDIIFFMAGLIGLLFFQQIRKAIFTGSLWKYILFFIAVITPNVWWQYEHQFPALQMFSRLYEMQLNELSYADTLKNIILSVNPVTIIIWLSGLIFMFNKNDKKLYRPLAFATFISICFLAYSRGKEYYFYPLMMTLMIFGSIFMEQKILQTKWLLYPVAAILLAGISLIPFGMPVLSLNEYINHYFKFEKHDVKDGKYSIKYDEYYSTSKWNKTLSAIKSVYDSLPEKEKTGCLIWGKHYSQAGAVALYGSNYNLPKTFSYHGSFYLWAPGGAMPETIIAFTNDEAGIDFFQDFFNTVIPVRKVYNPYADFDKDVWQTIYICKDPKQTFTDMKLIFKTRVFE
jgi:hypothetical protein